MLPQLAAHWPHWTICAAVLVSAADVSPTAEPPLGLPAVRLMSVSSKAARSSERIGGAHGLSMVDHWASGGHSSANEQARAVASKEFEACLSKASSDTAATIASCHKSAGMPEATLCSWYLEANCAHSDTPANLNPRCSGIDSLCQGRAGHSDFEAPGMALIGSGTTLRKKGENDQAVTKEATGSMENGTVKEKPMMFLHIPKNAGTAVEEAGRKVGIRWGRNHPELSFLRPMSTGEYCMRYHVPPSYLTRKDLYERAETFCITRNPYDRAVSEYTYLLNKDWAKGYLFLYDKPACTAEGLNYFLQMSLRRVQLGWKFTLDCHMLPQSEWIWEPTGRQWCDNIMKLEELPSAFDKLMASRGSPSRLSQEKENSSGDGACHGLGVKDLDNVSKEIIENVYWEDFDRLGYEQEEVEIPQTI